MGGCGAWGCLWGWVGVRAGSRGWGWGARRFGGWVGVLVIGGRRCRISKRPQRKLFFGTLVIQLHFTRLTAHTTHRPSSRHGRARPLSRSRVVSGAIFSHTSHRSATNGEISYTISDPCILSSFVTVYRGWPCQRPAPRTPLPGSTTSGAASLAGSSGQAGRFEHLFGLGLE